MAKSARGIVSKRNACEFLGKNPLGQRSIRADVEIEDYVISELRETGIPCALLGEEHGLTKISEDPQYLFVLDPLDGSENRMRGVPPYCFGIAMAPYGGHLKDVKEALICDLTSPDEFYCCRGKGVYWNHKRVHASKRKEMKESIISVDFYGEGRHISDSAKLGLIRCHDQRRLGPALLEICYTAAGCFDAYTHLAGTLSVIHASGVAMLYENCVVSDGAGRKLDSGFTMADCCSIIAAGTKELHSEILAAVGAEGERSGIKIRKKSDETQRKIRKKIR